MGKTGKKAEENRKKSQQLRKNSYFLSYDQDRSGNNPIYYKMIIRPDGQKIL